ncbi:MAG: hypothetical protein J7604_08020 [Sporocytophaga sp.]|uniref:hypothetical protein n=1 Tax=Sporocytophaga sp. TaxID=2231183 RepID=UPI001B1422B1|nr:hypothetical protein [Sporocytophaga sp.]MBO9700144.1 hypothetical protein [Sporocytophaga sp.]
MSSKITFTIYFILTLFFTALIPLIAGSNGIELTHDSGYYVQAARSFTNSDLFLDIHGNRLTLYPPGYALWLSFYQYTGLDILIFAMWSNAIFLLCILISSIFILKKAIKNPIIRLITFISIGLSTVLVQNGVFLWSDHLFIVFSVAYLSTLIAFLENKNGISLFLLVLYSVAGFYVRYIGITFIFSTVIALIVSENFSFGEKIKNIISYVIYSGFFLGLWLIRNYIVSGSLSIKYDKGSKSIFRNITDALEIISTYFIPNTLSSSFKLAFISILILACVIFSLKLRKHIPPAFNALISFIFAYLGFFILINTIKDICDFDDRYLSPVYIPVMIFTFIIIDRTIENFKYKKYLISVLCLWLIYPAYRTYKNALQWHKGVGYNTVNWKNNEVLNEVSKLSKNLIISNNPIPIILINNATAYSMDYKDTQGKDFYFVEWTNGERLLYLNTSENQFKKQHPLKKIKKMKDATIYYHTENAYPSLMKHDQ